MTSRNNSNYKWNIEKLKSIRNALHYKKRTPEEEKEYQLLLSLLACGDTIEGFAFEEAASFSDVFKSEFVTLFLDYYQFLPYIFEYYNGVNLDLDVQKLAQIEMSEDDILANVHDFYRDLDQEWLTYFNKIYRQRKDFLSFESCRPFSVYLSSSGIWIANLARTRTVADLVDTVHEYAHGIADQISPGIKAYSPDNILLELFPIVCQLIYLNQNDLPRLRVEITKYINNYLKTMHDFSEEILVKFNLAEAFGSVRNARCLSRLVRRTWGINLDKEEARILYATPSEENITYVFPFIVALELLDIYENDPDKFKYLMKQILVAEDAPLDTLKRLAITPNRRIH